MKTQDPSMLFLEPRTVEENSKFYFSLEMTKEAHTAGAKLRTSLYLTDGAKQVEIKYVCLGETVVNAHH